MRLLQIAYDVDTGAVIRAVLEGQDMAGAVTVTLADTTSKSVPSSPTMPEDLSEAQVGIASLFGYAEREQEKDGDETAPWLAGLRS